MFAFDRSRRLRRSAATTAFALAASFGLSGSAARAGTSTVDFSSTSSLKGLGSFKGSATLDGDLLTVQVTNTSGSSGSSAASSKGVLYGLAFDIEGGKAVYLKNDGKRGFKSVAPKHGLLIKPFGRYGDALQVNGSNKRALASGATRTLVFKVTGEPAGATAFDLLDNPNGASVIALFKGFRHDAHDKAGAAVTLRLAPSDLNASDTTGSTGTGGLPNGTGLFTGSDSPILSLTPIGTGTKPGAPGPTGGSVDGSLPGSGPAPAAIPLPPAAWTGLGTLAVLACAKLKRRSLKSLV